MSTIIQGGEPRECTIVNTNPKKAYFDTKFDVAYVFNLWYLQIPAEITAKDQTLTVPEKDHGLVMYKFFELCAELLGDSDSEIKFRQKYESKLRKERNFTTSDEAGESGPRFRWFE